MSWRDRLDVTVEVGERGVAVGEMVWDVSNWDDPTSTWSGVEPTFIAIPNFYVESFSCKRGRARGVDRHPAGTAELSLVADKPTRVWSFVPTTPVKIGEEVRVSVLPRGLDGLPLVAAPIPVFRGSARSIKDEWQPEKQGGYIFRLKIALSDRMADLAAINLPEQPDAGAGDLTHERVARIMALAAIDTYYLEHGPTVVTHQASNFARTLLDEAQVVVESEGPGDLYVRRDGKVFVRERRTLGTYPREDNVQLTWSNMSAVPGIAPTKFGTGTALDDVVNQVSMARKGSTAITVGGPDSDSARRYGLRTYQRFDLTSQDDLDVEFAAEWRLAEQIIRTQRLDQIECRINPDAPDADVLALADIDLGDRHHVAWTDGLYRLMGDAHVQGIEHRITADAWHVKVNLWAYAGEGLRPPVEVGGEYGRWGTGVWGTNSWGVGVNG